MVCTGRLSAIDGASHARPRALKRLICSPFYCTTERRALPFLLFAAQSSLFDWPFLLDSCSQVARDGVGPVSTWNLWYERAGSAPSGISLDAGVFADGGAPRDT